MTDATQEDVSAGGGRKGGAGAMVLALAALALGGGGGFFAGWSGLVSLPLPGGEAEAPAPPPGAPTGFVALDPLTISLGPEASSRFLRLAATIETAPGAEAAVERLRPRILDVLTTYLQALRDEDLDRPAALTRMRAHMLRRVRVAAGEERVRDLLVTEFVVQ